ncbi:hypothetical protein LMH87_009638 [Akanthomyces muscarius]|uniref:Uncharacterized protein n=1 Tax=Akanthomyces muscarius TaxID=2231603 RepID=A0A9W8QEE1_AKAMU|nr:hypothetical protein LMH87_009638 [Akanthomyces muscarius]KAJ4153134.1 hypothetical protein LMH87_009638 [Akanthomyces muscarius]
MLLKIYAEQLRCSIYPFLASRRASRRRRRAVALSPGLSCTSFITGVVELSMRHLFEESLLRHFPRPTWGPGSFNFPQTEVILGR